MVTDRHDDPDTTGSADFTLESRRVALLSPALRGRVLAAVDDVLAGAPPAPIGAVDRLPWAIAAALVAGLLITPWLTLPARGPLSPATSRVASLTERTLAAGLPADLLPPHSPPSSARLASAAVRVDDDGPAARLPDPFRIRRLLEGEF